MENGTSDHAGMAGRAQKPSQKPQEAQEQLFIGAWIRALGKRPVDLVKAKAINEGYLSSLISGGKTNPSRAKLRKIADFLEIPVEYLYQPPPNREFIAQAMAIDPLVLAKLRRASN